MCHFHLYLFRYLARFVQAIHRTTHRTKPSVSNPWREASSGPATSRSLRPRRCWCSVRWRDQPRATLWYPESPGRRGRRSPGATALRAFALGVSIDHQHGPVCVAQHLLGDAPDQGMLQPGRAFAPRKMESAPTSSTLCESQLRLIPFKDGYGASGVLCTLGPTPRSESQNPKRELRFRALLGEDEAELFFTLAWSFRQ
jgi:hypothetical protein